MKETTDSDTQQNATDKEKIKNVKVYVNEFGEIIRDIDVDEINQFLNENVKDKKLSSEE